jgi:hypothetical protein
MRLSALVVGLALGGATAAPAFAERNSRIDAVWTDVVGCASDPRDVAATVDNVLRPLRLDVRWREARPSDPTGPDELRIIMVAPTKWARESHVLGACIPTSPAPAIWVEYDNILGTLGLLPEPTGQSDRDRLALALARVIAHELVHVLVPDYGHDESGLLAPWLNPDGLTGPGMAWSPTLVRWFRQRRGKARFRKTPLEPEALIVAPAPEAPPPSGHTN